MVVTLYLVMRNDLHSLNPGKLAAQAAHVANVAVKRAGRRALKAWESQTLQGFGTTIVLGADISFIESKMPRETIVRDPTYPCEIPYEVAYHLIPRTPKNIHLAGHRAFYVRDEIVGAWAWAVDEKPPALADLELYP